MVVEVLAIPIVLKAVEFLFDETGKILEERRTARQDTAQKAAKPPEISLLDHDKANVLKLQVSEEMVRQKEKLIEGILEEVAIYQQNYQRLKKRVALEGGPEFAPINVVNQLQAQENAILEASKQLDSILVGLIEQKS